MTLGPEKYGGDPLRLGRGRGLGRKRAVAGQHTKALLCLPGPLICEDGLHFPGVIGHVYTVPHLWLQFS